MPRSGTGNNSVAEGIVFDNLGLGDELDTLDVGGDDRDDLDDDGDQDDDRGQGGDDDGLEELESRQDDQQGLDDLTSRQRQRAGGPRRDQFGRGRRDQQRDRQRAQQELESGILEDFGVSQTERRREAETKFDKEGNLVRVSDGQIVARKGREARYYQEGQKARREVETQSRRVRDVEDRLNAAIKIGQNLDTQLRVFQGQEANIKQLGLSAADQLSALRLFADLKSNPVNAIKTILTRAQARGITMDQLGLGTAGNGGVDAKSLADLINEQIQTQFAPIQQRLGQVQQTEQQRQQHEQAVQEATREIETFFDRNPDAKPYLKIFNEVIQNPQTRNMTYGEIWAKIQLNLARQQMRRPTGGQRGQRSFTPPPRGRMPQGRGRPDAARRDEVANPMVDYDDILHGVLDEVYAQAS